ncbi:MAG: hypothetical protein AAGB24_05745 [Bacteroidota bacterium]
MSLAGLPLLGIVLIASIYYKTNNSAAKYDTSTPTNVIHFFFEKINNKDFSSAYGLTENTAWPSELKFKEYLKYWEIFDVATIKGKSYYSKYDADTIINVTYRATQDETLKVKERDYDFHLKRDDKDWKIIRIFFPRDNETDALKKNEVPRTSNEAVQFFLDFLNNKKYDKAALLADNTNWGNKKEFTSKEKWGCVSAIKKYDVHHVKEINDDLHIVFAAFRAENFCSHSKVYREYFFVQKDPFGLWQIIDNKERLAYNSF